jgi:hypothetical protein
MIGFSAVALRSTTAGAGFVLSAAMVPRRSIRAYPGTALRGVRSSGDSVARNSSFSRLASFAREYERAFSTGNDARDASSRANRQSPSEYSRPDSARTNVIAPKHLSTCDQRHTPPAMTHDFSLVCGYAMGWNLNPCRQKSRAITKFERRGRRVPGTLITGGLPVKPHHGRARNKGRSTEDR